MSQESFLRDLDAQLMADLVDVNLADTAIYTPPGVSPTPIVGCHVKVDTNIQFFGDDNAAGVAGVRTVIRLQTSQVPTPERLAVVVVGSRTYKLDQKLDEEPGISSRWVVIDG